LVKFVQVVGGYSITVEHRKINPLCIVSWAKFLLDSISAVAEALLGTLRSLGTGLQYFKGGK
jgi:hypothetical protein